MAHNFVKNSKGQVDMYAMDPYGSPHNGPKCTICGVQFCISCNPEFMNTDCAQFLPSE